VYYKEPHAVRVQRTTQGMKRSLRPRYDWLYYKGYYPYH